MNENAWKSKQEPYNPELDNQYHMAGEPIEWSQMLVHLDSLVFIRKAMDYAIFGEVESRPSRILVPPHQVDTVVFISRDDPSLVAKFSPRHNWARSMTIQPATISESHLKNFTDVSLVRAYKSLSRHGSMNFEIEYTNALLALHPNVKKMYIDTDDLCYDGWSIRENDDTGEEEFVLQAPVLLHSGKSAVVRMVFALDTQEVYFETKLLSTE